MEVREMPSKDLLSEIIYKRELAKWSRLNRRNIALYKRRIDEYKRRLKLHALQVRRVHENFNARVDSLNCRYEALIAKAKLDREKLALDIERRAEIGRAICERDRALHEAGEAPIYPEFIPTPEKPTLVELP